MIAHALWPDHVAGMWLVSAGLALLSLAIFTLALRRTAYPLDFALTGLLILILHLAFAPPAVREWSLLEFGQVAQGTVANLEERTGARQGNRYYVSYWFRSEAGEEIYVPEERIDSDQYDRLRIGSPIPIHYLSSNPAICSHVGGGALQLGSFALVILNCAIASMMVSVFGWEKLVDRIRQSRTVPRAQMPPGAQAVDRQQISCSPAPEAEPKA
jgi:hypothetical protein